MSILFKINNKKVQVDLDPMTPLLWVIRDELKLKGTKYGCGKGMCGACTIHVDDQVYRSCSYPLKYVEGKNVRTIEGLAEADGKLHAIQQAWLEENVPQCGYCQPGFMMAAAKLISEIANPTDADIDRNISNICRCGTHPRIRKAIHRAAEIQKNKP
jgi:isoquinoline 1-oxidoreductase alpha subunit